ncbi:MAG: hypothetical protein SGJ27_03375 [Candidatus Melainabacteria bacterium]|nr:hypothetical protein [Candidatus Melainabacteria bacterium]
MTEDERSRADKLMHRRMLVLIPGFGRISAQKLLTKLVSQYENALTRLENLPEISETKELQSTYEQYFQKAHSIFVDCKRLISHPLARTKDGIRLKESIKERKKQLSALELRAKQLDGDLRDHYHMDQFKTDGGKASK